MEPARAKGYKKLGIKHSRSLPSHKSIKRRSPIVAAASPAPPLALTATPASDASDSSDSEGELRAELAKLKADRAAAAPRARKSWRTSVLRRAAPAPKPAGGLDKFLDKNVG